MEGRKKILVAMDGSEASMASVRYLSHIEALSGESVVLFHVFSPVSDYYWDMDGYVDPQLYREDLNAAIKCNHTGGLALQEHLEKAKSILMRSGFPGHRVEIKFTKDESDLPETLSLKPTAGINW